MAWRRINDSGVIDRSVKGGYRKTVAYNSKRYARVPTGAYTCPWCMQAVDMSTHRRTRQGKSSHAYGNCLVVPDGMEVKGYNPEYYYDLYRQEKGVGENTDSKVALDANEKKSKKPQK
ncbi:hypothetical protein LQZ18_09370 [Lachnospiraceae bacterium ZAX-1]